MWETRLIERLSTRGIDMLEIGVAVITTGGKEENVFLKNRRA